MKFKGISYDIGTEYTPGTTTRTGLSPEIITSDMLAIKNMVNCNSVRIFGKDKELLILSSEIALQVGLNVWLSPRFINYDTAKTIESITEIANEAEVLRLKYNKSEMVFVIAAEASLDTKGFLKGETIYDRIQHLANPLFFIKKGLGIKPSYQKDFGKFLTHATNEVKKFFLGKITYAAGMWEIVNWENFDFISVNFYKASFNKSYFGKALQKLNSKGKPLAITEFGCCTYLGADKKGPTGYTILDTTTCPPVFRGKCERSEQTQADYILDSLQNFEKENVEATFIFDFYSQHHLYNSNPDVDYDKASFSITKSVAQNKWEPKLAFNTISRFYKESI
jgi:hypothetical protein